MSADQEVCPSCKGAKVTYVQITEECWYQYACGACNGTGLYIVALSNALAGTSIDDYPTMQSKSVFYRNGIPCP